MSSKDTSFRVLSEPPAAGNWYTADLPLQAILKQQLTENTRLWLEPQLERMGELAPTYVDPRATLCDRQTPTLRKYDRYGERSVDECDYSPAYIEMERVAYGSGCVALKYEPEI